LNTDSLGIGSILVVSVCGGAIGGLIAFILKEGLAYTWDLIKFIWREKKNGR